MGQVRHGSATTTHAVRSAIQRSTAQQGIAVAISRERQARLAQLSRELGINPKTAARWRKREIVEDRQDGAERAAIYCS